MHDLYTPAIIARATKFGTVTYHDQTKNIRGWTTSTPVAEHPRTKFTKFSKHIPFPSKNRSLQYAFVHPTPNPNSLAKFYNIVRLTDSETLPHRY